MNQIDSLSQDIVIQINNIKTNLATNITNKGVTTANDASFSTMATNIANIPSGGGAYNHGDIISLSQTTQTSNYMKWIKDTGSNITFISQSANYVCVGSGTFAYIYNKSNGDLQVYKDFSSAGYGNISNILIDETNSVFYVILSTTTVMNIGKFNLTNGNTIINFVNSSSIATSWGYKDVLFLPDSNILTIFGVENTGGKCIIQVNMSTLALTGSTYSNGGTIKSIMYIYRWDLNMNVENATRIYVAFNGSGWYLFHEKYTSGSLKVGYIGFLSTAYKYTAIYDEINDILYTYYSNKIYKWNVPTSLSTSISTMTFEWGTNVAASTAFGNYSLYSMFKDGLLYLLGGNGILFVIVITPTYAYLSEIKNYPFQITKLNIYDKDLSNVAIVESTSVATAIRLNDFTKACTLV